MRAALLALVLASAAKPSEVNPKGFALPSMKGFDFVESRKMDATLALPGDETTVEVYENRRGDRAMRLTLNGVHWAWGILPGGDPLKGYVLRDPACNGKLTEKWAPDAPFSAPDCAVKAKAKPQ